MTQPFVTQLLVSDADDNLLNIYTTLPPGPALSINCSPVVLANDHAPITIKALQAGTNQIGNVSISVMPGFSTGSNLIGNVSISVLPGLSTSANNIGLVNTNAEALVTVGTSPNRAFIVGGVFNNSPPSLTNGQTVGLQVDSTGKLIINSVPISGTSTYQETTIATGGTAQSLFSGATPTNGYEIINISQTEILYFREAGTAVVAGATSVPIATGSAYITPRGYKPSGLVSVIAATTAHPVIGRSF